MWTGLVGVAAAAVGLPLLIVSAAIIPPWFGVVLAIILVIVWLRYRARRRARAPHDALVMAEFNELGKRYRHWLEPNLPSETLHASMMTPEQREELHRTGRLKIQNRVPWTGPTIERESYPPRLPRHGRPDLTVFDDPYDEEDPHYEGDN